MTFKPQRTNWFRFGVCLLCMARVDILRLVESTRAIRSNRYATPPIPIQTAIIHNDIINMQLIELKLNGTLLKSYSA